jgi:hypothetical protein
MPAAKPWMERGIRLYSAKNSGSSYLFCFTKTGIAAKRQAVTKAMAGRLQIDADKTNREWTRMDAKLGRR